MPRTPHIPLRDEEVVALGRAARLRYAGMTIEQVARWEGIRLEVTDRASIRRAGISAVDVINVSLHFESLAEEGILIASQLPRVKAIIKLIAVASDHLKDGEPVSTLEIFWHEYFHLNWSPELEPFDARKHDWITHGVLDVQDEHRADLFAAAVLIDRVDRGDTVSTIAERCTITLRLAEIALDIERAKRLFSRNWEPVYSEVSS